jgi:dolichyl-phosphate beta-glucosyltransferase
MGFVSASRPLTRSLSVVIPAYNEEARLPRTVERIHEFLVHRSYDAELLVVDDGSRDRTLSVARDLSRSLPLLRVITHPTNHGKGFAVRSGILAATRDAVLFSDADLSTPIEDIDLLWPWHDRGYDIVIASRRGDEGSKIGIPQPAYRRGMGKVFNLLVSMFGIRGFHDTQCGFKLFRREPARRVFSTLRTQGFAFDVEVLLRARRLGYRTREVLVRWDDQPGSHVDPVRDSARMLLEVLRMRGLG